MWRSRVKLSLRDILNLGLSEGSGAEVLAQETRSAEIHPALQNFPKLGLQSEELEARYKAGLEFHQNVHVAVRPEVITQDRAKQGQLADVMAAAEICNVFFRNVYLCPRHLPQPNQIEPDSYYTLVYSEFDRL
jgi:hypothetical protein